MTKNNSHNFNDLAAVVVCSHIAKDNMPVRIAVKDEPVSEEDSGWQFLCGQDVEENEPKLWALCEILDYDPSIGSFLHIDESVMLHKSSETSEWEVVVDP